jgi:hypothetical protein
LSSKGKALGSIARTEKGKKKKKEKIQHFKSGMVVHICNPSYSGVVTQIICCVTFRRPWVQSPILQIKNNFKDFFFVKLGMVVQACNPSTLKAEAGEL